MSTQKTKDYKKCGFRDRVDVCRFRAEDCNPSECDMHDIPFTAKGILKQANAEKKIVRELRKKLKVLKKEGKTDEVKEIKAKIKDKGVGGVKLLRAYAYCKRRGVE